MKTQDIKMNITQVGDQRFSAKTYNGAEILVEPSPILGGCGTIPNPMEYLIAAVGTCAAIKIQIDLKKIGYPPESIDVDVVCSQMLEHPQVLEQIHLVFTIKGQIEENIVISAINEVMTLYCPVAVMVSQASKISWEQVIRYY